MSAMNPDETAYLLNGIPRELWDRAKEKAYREIPRLSMRWVLIDLLNRWVGPETDLYDVRPMQPQTLHRKLAAMAQRVAKTPPGSDRETISVEPIDGPDLGGSF